MKNIVLIGLATLGLTACLGAQTQMNAFNPEKPDVGFGDADETLLTVQEPLYIKRATTITWTVAGQKGRTFDTKRGIEFKDPKPPADEMKCEGTAPDGTQLGIGDRHGKTFICYDSYKVKRDYPYTINVVGAAPLDPKIANR